MLGVVANAEPPGMVLCTCCLVNGIEPPSQVPSPLQLQLPMPLQLPLQAATNVLLRSITSTSSKIIENFLHPLKADIIL